MFNFSIFTTELEQQFSNIFTRQKFYEISQFFFMFK